MPQGAGPPRDWRGGMRRVEDLERALDTCQQQLAAREAQFHQRIEDLENQLLQQQFFLDQAEEEVTRLREEWQEESSLQLTDLEADYQVENEELTARVQALEEENALLRQRLEDAELRSHADQRLGF